MRRPSASARVSRGPVARSRRASGPGGVRAALPAGLVAAALIPAVAAAQTVPQMRDDVRAAIGDANFAAQYEALTLFGGERGLSAAHYKVGDDEISTANLPLSFTPAEIAPGALAYFELTLGSASISQTELVSFRPGDAARVAYDVVTYSGIGGAGVEIDAGRGFRLRPVALLGYARVEDDTTFSGPGAAFTDAATRGILFNARVDSLLYGGAFEFQYDQAVTDAVDLSVTGRYTRIWAEVVDATDRAWEAAPATAFDTFSAHAEFEGPTGATLMGRDLRWLGFVGGAAMLGEAQAQGLGFTGYGEVGGGLRIVDRETFPYIEGGVVRGSVVFGDDLIGWSIGASLDF